MKNYDVFNGDADGICSLVQLRLAEPRDAVLVTGVKRDIKLLDRLHIEPNDAITVLDISMQKNHAALVKSLDEGATVFYADHHNPGERVEHSSLEALIDTSSLKCTALIIDEHLNHKYPLWAITAAFGDNLSNVAYEYASRIELSSADTETLKLLGELINYNGYGASLDDLFFPPDELYKACVNFTSPLDFVQERQDIISILKSGYEDDLSKALTQPLLHSSDTVNVIKFPNDKWARRISGTFSNIISNKNPTQSHIILTEKNNGDYVVSLRAPQDQLTGADEIALQFPTGGGRKGAAGINALPEQDLARLIECTETFYS
ncbi:MAG TPA: DHH family phosphoesterase [Methylophaga aminisulfidivorans]|uniref:DHH family phosphoesterase n=1 Tax=Methylophaga aminisulfidivorans TaxID=230105 RepID=A0A7C1VRA6_9GAMM|nr:DHH family phosphoesterase [Methylophaga aminisulfidivorans]